MSRGAVAARPGVPVRRRRRGGAGGRSAGGAAGSRIAVWRRRLVVLCALTAALAAGYFLWFRDSSLVEVREVRVTGLSGPEEAEITAALQGAGLRMTTLHVRTDELVAAVQGYPVVGSLRVSTDFPHGLQIEVTERRPVARVSSGSDEVAVSADGILLPAVVTEDLELPVIEADPGDSAVSLDGAAADQAAVLGAAPEPLRRVTEGTAVSAEGIEVHLEGGISLRFGTPSRAAAKWDSAARILADPGLESLSYIDLRSPSRPAVGGAFPVAEQPEVVPLG
jgi:cell division protein FtsQ